jgi:hypothetical protein
VSITKSKFKRCLRCGRKIATKGELCKTCQDKATAEQYTKPPSQDQLEVQRIAQEIEDSNHHNEIYERFAINYYREHGIEVPEDLLESYNNRLKRRQQLQQSNTQTAQ